MSIYRLSNVNVPVVPSRLSALGSRIWYASSSLRRYVMGIIPIPMIVFAFSVGRFFWCRLLSFDDWLTTLPSDRPIGLWYMWLWFIGMAIMTSPVWAPRLGDVLIEALSSSSGAST